MLDPKKWPSWWYGPDGQSAVFNAPLEVPEGWHDTPAKFGDDGKALEGAESFVPGLEEIEASDNPVEDEDEGVPAYNDITAEEIRTKLADLGVEFAGNADKASLYNLLTDSVEGN